MVLATDQVTMDKMLLRVFQGEVERQCKFSLIASNDLISALKSVDMDRIWFSVQAFLVAAGNISKLLWPSREIIKTRGLELRTSLGVDCNSPLEPRTFRNHFEHFDERLEKWATSSQRRNFADSNIGPSGMIVGLDAGDFLRNFDATNYVVTFRGDTYNLRPIIHAIEKLYAKAIVEASKPHRI